MVIYSKFEDFFPVLWDKLNEKKQPAIVVQPNPIFTMPDFPVWIKSVVEKENQGNVIIRSDGRGLVKVSTSAIKSKHIATTKAFELQMKRFKKPEPKREVMACPSGHILQRSTGTPKCYS